MTHEFGNSSFGWRQPSCLTVPNAHVRLLLGPVDEHDQYLIGGSNSRGSINSEESAGQLFGSSTEGGMPW